MLNPKEASKSTTDSTIINNTINSINALIEQHSTPWYSILLNVNNDKNLMEEIHKIKKKSLPDHTKLKAFHKILEKILRDLPKTRACIKELEEVRNEVEDTLVKNEPTLKDKFQSQYEIKLKKMLADNITTNEFGKKCLKIDETALVTNIINEDNNLDAEKFLNELLLNSLKTQDIESLKIIGGFEEGNDAKHTLIYGSSFNEIISRIIQNCLSIKRMEVRYCDDNTTKDIADWSRIDYPAAFPVSLANALKTNKNITEFSLSLGGYDYYHFKNSMMEFSEVLRMNTTLTSLSLRFTSVCDNSAIKIAKALERNEVLSYLDLSRNNIADDGLCALANMLGVNKTLTTLLVDDQFTNEGNDFEAHDEWRRPTKLCLYPAYFADALLHNRSLTELGYGGLKNVELIIGVLQKNYTLTTLHQTDETLITVTQSVLKKSLEENMVVSLSARIHWANACFLLKGIPIDLCCIIFGYVLTESTERGLFSQSSSQSESQSHSLSLSQSAKDFEKDFEEGQIEGQVRASYAMLLKELNEYQKLRRKNVSGNIVTAIITKKISGLSEKAKEQEGKVLLYIARAVYNKPTLANSVQISVINANNNNTTNIVNNQSASSSSSSSSSATSAPAQLSNKRKNNQSDDDKNTHKKSKGQSKLL